MSSLRYWKEREEAWRQELKRQERSILTEIRREYDFTLREIEAEINRLYVSYASRQGISMSEMKQRASKMDVKAFNQKAAEYVKKRDFSEKANRELKTYNLKMRVNRLELLRAYIELELDRLAGNSESILRNRLESVAAQEYARQAGILGIGIKPGDQNIEKIVNASFHNATFSERIWSNMEAIRWEINKTVNRLILRGEHPTKYAGELIKRLHVSRYEAERILITETARVQGEVQRESFREAGFQSYVFLAEPTACPVCRSLDGEHFPLEEQMPGINMYPMHPFCRCSTGPYEEISDLFSEEYNRAREAERTVVGRIESKVKASAWYGGSFFWSKH